MRKIALSFLLLFLFSSRSHAQLMVAKMVGKDAAKYGLGYGLFSYIDIPRSVENQSFRVEVAEFVFFPSKGEKYFTSTADARGYLSIKLGYKYVFSETQQGFYVIPSVGYCRVVDVIEGNDPTYGDGFAAAFEGGYSLGVGQKGHSLNLGLKYEYDHGNATHILQAVGLRFTYAFNLFAKKD